MLHHVDLTALRPLCGDYGRVMPGVRFTTDNETARSLEMRGLAQRYHPPSALRRILAALFQPPAPQTEPPPNGGNGKMLTNHENKEIQAQPPPIQQADTPRRRGRPPIYSSCECGARLTQAEKRAHQCPAEKRATP